MEVIIALTVLGVAGIAGWATVASVSMFTRGMRSTTDPRLLDRVREIADSVDQLRSDLDEMARKQENDVYSLEERLDFAERLLSKSQDSRE